MNQALDTLLQLDKRAVVGNVDHLTLDDIVLVVLVLDIVPRMRLQLLEAKGNSILGFVEIQNLDLDLLVQRNHFGGMSNASPRQVVDMQQAVHAAKVDKHAEVGNILDAAFENLAFFEIGQNLLALLFHAFFYQNTMRNHDVLAKLIDLDNLELHFLADQSVKIANGPDVDLRTRKKRVHAAKVDNNTALDSARARTHQGLVLVIGIENTLPGAHEIRLALGEHKLAVFVLDIVEIDFDVVTDGNRVRLAEFFHRNYALGLKADVDSYLFIAHGQNFAHDELTFPEVGHCLVVQIQHLAVFGVGVLSFFLEIFEGYHFVLKSLRRPSFGFRGRRRCCVLTLSFTSFHHFRIIIAMCDLFFVRHEKLPP